MYEIALEILKKIEKLGYEAYIVGGYPRDKYIKKDSKDIDICTSAKPEFLFEYFDVVKDNSKFGSIVIKKGNYEFEITSFRKDIYKDNRYPEIIFVDTLEEDLKRRDFTINTLCINSKGEFIDVNNCVLDIDSRIIKTVIDPNISLKEDPLRIIRAIRFSLELNFKIDNELIEAIITNKSLISNISKKRLNLEINKINKNDNYYKIIETLDLTNYLK